MKMSGQMYAQILNMFVKSLQSCEISTFSFEKVLVERGKSYLDGYEKVCDG